MTALEAADLLFDRQIAQHETSRKRVSDLTTVGYLRVSGDRRNNPGSSSPADVLYITAEGFRALDNLRETGWSK
jgi:hypothetical protein